MLYEAGLGIAISGRMRVIKTKIGRPQSMLHNALDDGNVLNPAEWVWSHVKRTGTARHPLRKGEKLSDKIEEQRAKLQQMPQMIRSFFRSVLTPLFPAAE
jgi:hypothetical protein